MSEAGRAAVLIVVVGWSCRRSCRRRRLVVPSFLFGLSCRRRQAGRALGLINSADLHKKLSVKGSPNWPWPGWSPWSMAQPYSSVLSSVI